MSKSRYYWMKFDIFRGLNNNMKLKQPNNQRKHFALPHIKNFEPNRFTPRKVANNRSLPKIPTSYAQQIQENSIVHIFKEANPDKQRLKEKLKSIYKKKNNIILNNIETEPNNITADESNMTNNFQKEIQKNLLIIKRQKENKRFNHNVNKMRYNSPPPIAMSTDELVAGKKKQPRCATQEDVFSKINDIIMNSQSKSALLIDEGRSVSYSTIVKNQVSYHRAIEIKKSRKRIKTDFNQPSNMKSQNFNQIPIKHEGNYNQWRKVSIDTTENGQIKYDVSSYQLETDRLQKIRSKNDLSLKKYFQGKTYLNKLMNYRQSSSLASKKQ